MAASTLITDYMGQGPAAARPGAPPVASGALSIYYADDTGVLSIWDTASAAWVSVPMSLSLGAVGAGLTITSPGTVALDALGAGLSLAGGTISAEWNAGTITALGANLTETGGTLAATGGPSEWNAGTVAALGANLTLTGGTLAATGGGGLSEWNAGTVTALGANLSLTSGTLAGTGGGGGLYDLSAGVPVLAGFTQIGITGDASIMQWPAGAISLTDTGTNVNTLEGITLAAPSATPYRVAMLISDTGALTNFRELEWGWSDGTQYHTLALNNQLTYLGETWATSSSRSSYTSNGSSGSPSKTGLGTFWVGLHDDGTNVHFEVGDDGVNFVSIFSAAKTSYLGSSGYTHIFLGINPCAPTPMVLTLRCYDTNGLNRSFP